MRHQWGIASIVYKFFDKKSKGGSVNNEIKQNEQLAEELHKPITKKNNKKSPFFIWRRYLGSWLSWYAINK